MQIHIMLSILILYFLLIDLSNRTKTDDKRYATISTYVAFVELIFISKYFTAILNTVPIAKKIRLKKFTIFKLITLPYN